MRPDGSARHLRTEAGQADKSDQPLVRVWVKLVGAMQTIAAMPGRRAGATSGARPRGGQVAWPAILLLVALTASCSTPDLPPIPQPSLEGFAAAVQEQLRAARANAAADPLDTSLVGRLGRVLYTFGQYRAAAACFERCRGLEPEEFEWAYLLGVVRAELGQVDLARASFEAAAAMRPGDLPTTLRLADLLERSGDTSRASAILEPALEASPNVAAVSYRLGRLAAAENPALAVRHLEAALEIEPGYREALYALAGALRSLGLTAEASRQLALYERADPGPRRHYEDPLLDAMDSIRDDSVQEMFNDGYARQQSGDLASARDLYSDILEIAPDHVQAHVNLVAVHGQSGDYARSAVHYERAVALDPTIAEAHYNHGVSRHFAGEYEAAADAFRKALEINPLHADSHSNLGTALDAMGHSSEALRHYEDALRHNPAHPMANFHLGRWLAERRRYGDALPYLEKAVATESEGTPLHAYLLALVHREMGQDHQSREYGQLALRLARERGAADLVAQIQSELAP